VPDTVDPQAVVAIIQARLGSVRFPRKVLADLGGMPLVEFMIERVRQATTVGAILLAVPEGDLETPLAQIAARQEVELVGGSETDVLTRFADAVRDREETIVVRLTADCPLIDPDVIDRAVEVFVIQGVDYLRTDLTFPDGLDVEVTTREALLAAAPRATAPAEREHVMPWIAAQPAYRQSSITHSRDLGHLRLTVDEPEDLEVVRAVLNGLAREVVSLSTIGSLYDCSPELFWGNAAPVRDEGAALTNSQKLWRRAKRVIPGGVSLLSKRPDMHLPDKWPTYFTAANGCRVTSLDGGEYLDMGMMGVGTSILGFGDPRVDEAVTSVVRQGVVSTLNCPEEVLLAERLVELHPWSAQARFARTGGEACAMAVRIARAASGRDGVAICGYHGWHDWYLAANLSEDSALDEHLLPGLSTRGVPRALVGTTVAFNYNDLDGLKEIVESKDIGVIIMEAERTAQPEPGFLEGVRQLATELGIVLIFDESTSAFRQVLGGHHLTLGVNPDMAVFGKTLGNGYAITAVLGTDAVMDTARELFISSTFWSERIGPAAGLASLQAMGEEDAPSRIHQIGLRYRKELGERTGLAPSSINFTGLPAISVVGLASLADGALLRTYVTGRLLERGYLAGPALYATLPHEEHVLEFAEWMGQVLLDAESLGAAGLEDQLSGQRRVTQGFARLA
jgi:glutamate-1-semialdehyde 2,1-aminomutase